MSHCVVDCSVAMAWVLPTESEAATDDLLHAIAADGAVVPSLWPTEVANVLALAERRKRISTAERQTALRLLADLPIAIEPLVRDRVWGEAIAIAAQHRLTAYDALYLDLALRTGLPLATLDRDLLVAARVCGVTVLPG